ncbi:MAG: YggS family pyridoxal phosphate-dependent enzyme [Deltaproteobacteria bacterium]|nr:YggS family pyridoxal phosphate-dependent enzyme [Deltaproteobacteria bacterium]
MPVRENIEIIRTTIAEAALRSGRNPGDVRLMAVTKMVDEERIREAVACGVDIIGENYVQEAAQKIDGIGHGVEWHMIGHLQSNKAKYAVRLFNLIHSVDRVSLAEELDRRSGKAGCTTRILIEVNASGEDTKSGVAVGRAVDLVKAVAVFRNLSVQGLMAMAAWSQDPEQARGTFRAVRELRDRIIEADISGVTMKELSMGMTDEYPVAVEEGATIVRIGRAIFGERKI